MIDDLTPESVASEVKLLRDDAEYDGTFLFVEGETDAIFFSNFVTPKECQIRFLLGRDKVLDIVSLLEKDGFSGFFAIIDADFYHIENTQLRSENICITDFHDLEIMLVNSPALEKVLKEYIPSTKLSALLRVPNGITQALHSTAHQIARIRWANHKYRLNISFYADSQKTTYLDWREAIIFQRGNFYADSMKVMDIICPSVTMRQNVRDKLSKDNHIKTCDMRQLCNGHDVVFVIYILILNNGRRKEVEKLNHKDIEKSLRLAYETKYFVETHLYQQIAEWQKKNNRTVLSIM